MRDTTPTKRNNGSFACRVLSFCFLISFTAYTASYIYMTRNAVRAYPFNDYYYFVEPHTRSDWDRNVFYLRLYWPLIVVEEFINERCFNPSYGDTVDFEVFWGRNRT